MEICPFMNVQGNICPCDNRCALQTPEGCSFRVIAEALNRTNSNQFSDSENLKV